MRCLRQMITRRVAVALCAAGCGVAIAAGVGPRVVGGMDLDRAASSASGAVSPSVDAWRTTSGANRWTTRVDRNPFLGQRTVVPAPEPPAAPEVLLPPVVAVELPRVRSILFSLSPTAVINGIACREGDEVAGFRIREIRARSVVVERDGVTHEIVR